MKDFKGFNIITPFYALGIARQLSPACQVLFHTIVYVFNANDFANELKISSRVLADISGLSYSNISAVRKSLVEYRYKGEQLLYCEETEKRKEPIYRLNKDLFLRLNSEIELGRKVNSRGAK